MHAFNVDGLWILHMGDVGYELVAEELVLFDDHCDMILVLTGKNPDHEFSITEPYDREPTAFLDRADALQVFTLGPFKTIKTAPSLAVIADLF